MGRGNKLSSLEGLLKTYGIPFLGGFSFIRPAVLFRARNCLCKPGKILIIFYHSYTLAYSSPSVSIVGGSGENSLKHIDYKRFLLTKVVFDIDYKHQKEKTGRDLKFIKFYDLVKSQRSDDKGKSSRCKAQIRRNEVYLLVRCND